MKAAENPNDVYADNQGSDLVAQMLADTNCTVIYRDLSTAYADLKSKVIVMPLWKVSKIVSILLRAHEVSHLLHTPYSGFHDVVTLEHPLIKEADIKIKTLIKNYVNALEDIRIERLISLKYAGLKKIFAVGHYELYKMGFYKRNPKQKQLIDTSRKFSTVDKVLLLSRLGVGVPGLKFTNEDKKWFELANTTQTFDEVVQLAVRLYLLEEGEKNSLFSFMQDFINDLKSTPEGRKMLEQMKKDAKERKSRGEESYGDDGIVIEIEDDEPSESQGSGEKGNQGQDGQQGEGQQENTEDENSENGSSGDGEEGDKDANSDKSSDDGDSSSNAGSTDNASDGSESGSTGKDGSNNQQKNEPEKPEKPEKGLDEIFEDNKKASATYDTYEGVVGSMTFRGIKSVDYFTGVHDCLKKAIFF